MKHTTGNRMENNGLKKFFKRNSMILTALLLLVLVLSVFTDTFLTTNNILSVMRQISVDTVLAFGMAMVLIIGGIDLSVGSVLALSGCICVTLINSGMKAELAIMITLCFGAVCGLVNGLIATFTTIPSFIITLATQQCFRGASYLMTGGKSIMCYDDHFNAIGTGYAGPVPILAIVIVICLVFTCILLNKTKFGRGMYAIGGNKNAAVYAGIKVKKITASVFVITGMFSALAGIIAASRVYSGQPNAGEGFECNAIAAAVLGGVSFNGGIGTAGGVMIGVLIMGFMNNGLNMLHVTSYWQIIIKGLLILLAVYLDTMRSNKRLHKKRWRRKHAENTK